MLTSGFPLYYSPERTNLRWLGGSFKHDFVVIPNDCKNGLRTPLLYDRLFETIFQDVVNLDNVSGNSKILQDLVSRGLVSKSALSPVCKIIGNRKLSKNKLFFLKNLVKF
ncbi:MAG: hypothetical protein HC906_11930 [Bacteroidales bacterium]|nr:hypothetical protein [Bacteroidales bacterium]